MKPFSPRNLFGLSLLAGIAVIYSFIGMAQASARSKIIKQQEGEIAEKLRILRSKIANLSQENTREISAKEQVLVRGPQVAKKTEPPSNLLRVLSNDPTLQTLKMAADRAHLYAKYLSFFRSAKLSDTEVNDFIQISSKFEEQKTDIYDSARAKGISTDDPAVKDLAHENSQAHDDALKNLLGENGYSRYQEYARTADLREVVGGISANATLVGVPLSPEQSEQLVQALANASDSYMKGHSAESYSVDWAKADLSARAILSPEQFNAFTNQQSNTASNISGRQLILLNQAISAAVKADADAAH